MKLLQIIPLAIALLVPSAAFAAEKGASKDHSAETSKDSKSSSKSKVINLLQLPGGPLSLAAPRTGVINVVARSLGATAPVLSRRV